MNEASDIAAFGAVLCTAFETFKSAETLIREQYARDVATGAEPAGADEDDLLERPTRRFLVDGILRGLIGTPTIRRRSQRKRGAGATTAIVSTSTTSASLRSRARRSFL